MTTQRRRDLVTFLGACLLALAACGGAEAPAEDAPEAGAPPGAVDAEVAIDDLTLGARLALDGSIDEGWGSDEFLQGERIYVAMEVADAPVGSDIRVEWIGPDGEVVDEETKEVLPRRPYLSFRLDDTVALPLGEYRVRVFYEGERVGELGFEVKGT